MWNAGWARPARPAAPTWPPPPMQPIHPMMRSSSPLPGGSRALQPFNASLGPSVAPTFRGYAPPLPSGFAPPHAPSRPPYYPPAQRPAVPVFPPLPAARGAPLTYKAPPDPDKAWLEQFKQTHLSKATPPREPPLRRLAAMKARAEPLIAQLEALAANALAIDAYIASIELHDSNSTASNLLRLKEEREAKLEACERVKAELDAMHASTLFVPPEQLPQLLAFMQHVQKKKVYRRNRRRRLRHEASVLRAAKAATEPPSGVDSDDAEVQTHVGALTSSNTSAATDRADQSTEAAKLSKNVERERAQRLLLLLDIKEKRLTGDEPAEVADAIRRDRAMLRRALRPPQHRRDPTSLPDSDVTAASEPPATPPARVELASSGDQVQPSSSTSSSTDVMAVPLSLESLVTRRRAWDRFLVAPHTPGASRIPPHLVVPPAHPPDSPWRRFAVS